MVGTHPAELYHQDHPWEDEEGRDWSLSAQTDLCAICHLTPDCHPTRKQFLAQRIAMRLHRDTCHKLARTPICESCFARANDAAYLVLTYGHEIYRFME